LSGENIPFEKGKTYPVVYRGQTHMSKNIEIQIEQQRKLYPLNQLNPLTK